MMNVVVDSKIQPWRLARSVNQTSASFVSKVPTTTEPKGDAGTATGASVIELSNNGMCGPSAAKIVPFGTTTNDNTFNVRVIGWERLPYPSGLDLWVPTTLAEVTATLGTSPGVDGTLVTSSNLFADTLVLVTGNANVSMEIISPANDTIAHFIVSLKGSMKLELSFSIAGGTATDMNALVKLM